MFTSSLDQEFNSMILVMLAFRNMTKTELAQRIGVSKQHLNRLLRNKIEWKLKHALPVMRELDFTPDSFYEELWISSAPAF